MNLFASDFDGTFCKHSREGIQQIPANKEAVKRWKEAGHSFIFATGRAIPFMTYETTRYGLDYDYIVGLNGAVVMTKENEIIYQATIKKGIAAEIISYIVKENYFCFMVSDGFTGTVNMSPNETERFKKMVESFYDDGLFNLPLTESLKRPVSQISIMGLTQESARQLAISLEEFFGNEVLVYPNTRSVDISPKGTSKALGIQHLINHLNTSPNEIYCIGDSWNDVEMLETFTGFSMTESPYEIKSISKKTFNTVEEAIDWSLSQSPRRS